MKPYYERDGGTIYCGDARDVLATLPECSVDCCVTSPPYFGLRDYGTAQWEGGDPACDHRKSGERRQLPHGDGRAKDGYAEARTLIAGAGAVYREACGKCGARRRDQQIGLEPSPEAYVAELVAVFREVRRLLKPEGTLFLNLGDSYASGGTRSSRSLSRRHEIACGSDGKEPLGFPGTDSVCSDLCDGCRAVLSSYNSGSGRPRRQSQRRVLRTAHGIEPMGSASTFLDALPHAALASTIAESSAQPSAPCLHCANCGACLSVLRSSSRDATLCGRRERRTHGNARASSVGHIGSMDASGMACLNYTLKPKDLIGIPWRVAFALQADGWYLRSDIIWCLSGGATVYARTQKGDMPMSVKDMVRLDPRTVKLWNGKRWTQALGWSRSLAPRDGALEIELRSGERVGCTPGHEWPTQRGNVRADALVPGDVIQTTRLPEPDAPIVAAALDTDVAWLCGLYLAEGSISGDTVQIAAHKAQTDVRLARLSNIARQFHGSAAVHADADGDAASINLNGPLMVAIIRAYIHGRSARTKGLKTRVWQRSDAWLLELLGGYLAGDGHFDAENERWRLGFTRNDRLAGDLRTLAARLGLSMRLAPTFVEAFGKKWPAYRGDVRLERTAHHNARINGEVVAVRAGRGRQFWDIGVADDPHLFALASGVLTHNSKPNPMPESVRDRPTRSHEYVFLLSKSERYYYDQAAVAERSVCNRVRGPSEWLHVPDGGNNSGLSRRSATETRNARDVWTIATEPFPDSHFAVFPTELARRCILAGCPEGGTVLDPFSGSGTVALVAKENFRRFVGMELNPGYCEMAAKRLRQRVFEFATK